MFLSRWLPGLANLLHYRREWFHADLQAGLSVAAIQIPIAIAYAQIVGLPPQYGLYACVLPMIVYALIGSSRQLMVGPDAATCAMIGGAVAPWPWATRTASPNCRSSSPCWWVRC